MRTMQFEGATEEEAVRKASERLDIAYEQVRYQVIDRGGESSEIIIDVELPAADGESDNSLSEPQPTDTETEQLQPTDTEAEQLQPTDTEAEQLQPTEYVEKASEVLKTILNYMGLDIQVDVQPGDRVVRLYIEGMTENLLTGRQGQTLEALQHLVSKIVNRSATVRRRIVVDVRGFQDKEKEDLVVLAKSLGEKATKLGKIIKINPMKAEERKVIHLALDKVEGVTTCSEGQGIFRKLLIIPSERQNRKKYPDEHDA